MQDIKNKFISENQSVLIAIFLTLFSWPLARISGLEQAFIFSLAMFFILFEVGIDMMAAVWHFFSYFVIRKERGLHSAIGAFWHGLIRIWIASVLWYMFVYVLNVKM